MMNEKITRAWERYRTLLGLVVAVAVVATVVGLTSCTTPPRRLAYAATPNTQQTEPPTQTQTTSSSRLVLPVMALVGWAVMEMKRHYDFRAIS